MCKRERIPYSWTSKGNLRKRYYWLMNTLKDGQPHCWLKKCEFKARYFLTSGRFITIDIIQYWWSCQEEDRSTPCWWGVIAEAAVSDSKLAGPVKEEDEYPSGPANTTPRPLCVHAMTAFSTKNTPLRCHPSCLFRLLLVYYMFIAQVKNNTCI